MKKILLSIMGLVCCAVLLTACGGGGDDGASGGTDSAGGANTTEPVDTGGTADTTAPTEIRINVEDAFAGNVWSDVTLKFSGASVNDDGGSVSEKVLAADAEKSFVVKTKGLTGTDSVVVTAEALGYLDTGASVVVSPGDSARQVNLRMVKSTPGSVVKGIFTTEMDISPFIDNTNGTTTQNIELTSKDNASPGATIKIPSGTVLTDATGSVVPDGILRVTSFNPNSPRALAAYPGGMDVIADTTGADGNGFADDSTGNFLTGDAQISFKTAGFVAVTIQSSSGQKVKNFSQPVTMSIEVDDKTTDVSGNPIGVGSVIPVWSYNEDEGKWRFEKKSDPIQNASLQGGFGRVEWTTTHLSYFNLDWNYYTGESQCTTTGRINLLLPDGSPDLNTYDVVIKVGTAPSYLKQVQKNGVSDGFIDLYNMPANHPGIIEFYSNGALVHTLDLASFCNGNGTGRVLDVTIGDIDPEPTPVNLSFACPVGVNVPGYNSDTVPFNAILAPANGTSSISINGQGQVFIPVGDTVSFAAVPNFGNQQTLYSAIADPSSIFIDIVGTDPVTPVDIKFMLSEAFCNGNPLGIAMINGDDSINNTGDTVCSAPGDVDGDLTSTPQKDELIDLVRSANGDIYFSTRKGPDMTEVSLKRWPYNTSLNAIETVISYGTTNYPDHDSLKPASSVTARAPWGLDLQQTNEGEVIYYADRLADCVNALYLSTMEVTTVAGQCGAAGDIDEVDIESKLRTPTDVAIDASGHILYLTDSSNRKVKMVTSQLGIGMASSLKNRIGGNHTNMVTTIAGAGSGPNTNLPNGDYTNGDNALTTAIGAAWLDVAPDNTVVISGNGGLVSRIFDITVPGSTQLQSPKIIHLAGGYEDLGSNLDQFWYPNDIEIDTLGNVLVADFSNHRIKMIEVNNYVNPTVIPIAGNGIHSWSPTCGVATQQSTSIPRGIWIEQNGGPPPHVGTLHDFIFTQYGNSVPNWIRQVRY